MKIIIRDRLNRPTEPDRLFILHVPEREGKIIVEALNHHALGYDSYECVEDSYKLYVPRESTKEYFIELSRIWKRWFDARKGGEPYSMLQRDKDIAWLQTNWEKSPIPFPARSSPRTKPRIILKLGGILAQD
jgi:hypothetical protein